jgi:hypothetical protein
MYTYERLREENETFAGTGGVSEHNATERFLPAFLDRSTGRVEPARREDGAPAPMHLLYCLPDEWVAARDAGGCIIALKDSIVAGFVRDGVFYTREQAADACDPG